MVNNNKDIDSLEEIKDLNAELKELKAIEEIKNLKAEL